MTTPQDQAALDAAQVIAIQAGAIRQLVDAGYNHVSAKTAVITGDLSQLVGVRYPKHLTIQ